jgi:hypothetical protein
MKLITVLILGTVFAAGVITGVFLSESGTLTAEDIKRLRNYTTDKLGFSDEEGTTTLGA